jgi:NADPH:quinone reductase-like Zn-dependent oxidoreductase
MRRHSAIEGAFMKSQLAVAITASAVATGCVALAAVATAAPAGPSQIIDTVRSLESQGYNVVVNRTGGAPLSQCSVRAVRPGQTHATTDSRGGSSLNTTVTSRTVYLDVAC